MKPDRCERRAATAQSAPPCGIPKTMSAATKGKDAARTVVAGLIHPINAAELNTIHGIQRAPEKANSPALAG